MNDRWGLSCKYLIFDLDGTLVDSGDVVERVWKIFSDRFGFDFEKDVLPICHGRPAKYPLMELMPTITQKEIDDVEKEFGEMEISMIDGLLPIKGAYEFLKSIPCGRWAIATSCSKKLALARLKGAGLPIPKILVTAEMVEKAKPFPDPFLKAAELLEVSPSDCVVFEDSPAGISSGKSAGAVVIGINMTDIAKKVSSPDFSINNMSEVRIEAVGEKLNISKIR